MLNGTGLRSDCDPKLGVLGTGRDHGRERSLMLLTGQNPDLGKQTV